MGSIRVYLSVVTLPSMISLCMYRKTAKPIESGDIKPTQMLAGMTKDQKISSEFCIRMPVINTWDSTLS